MPLATGTDLISIERVAAAVQRHGDRFLRRVYTEDELTACGGRAESLAARWAAKEAVAKALGTGIGGVTWREIEVLQDECGCPRVLLRGAAAEIAGARGLTDWSISLTHEAGLALAFVVTMG
jgi:holo-[acyl-carrier protein] synthase